MYVDQTQGKPIIGMVLRITCCLRCLSFFLSFFLSTSPITSCMNLTQVTCEAPTHVGYLHVHTCTHITVSISKGHALVQIPKCFLPYLIYPNDFPCKLYYKLF